jgi:hypothetical protein
MVLDGDKFLSINIGDSKVSDLMDAVPEGINSTQVNSKLFGSSNRKATSDALAFWVAPLVGAASGAIIWQAMTTDD